MPVNPCQPQIHHPHHPHVYHDCSRTIGQQQVGKCPSTSRHVGRFLSRDTIVDTNINTCTPDKLPLYAVLSSTSSAAFLLSVVVPQISNTPVPTLVDCGATECFISPDFAPLKFCSTLTCPIQLRLFNGSVARLMTQAIDQQFCFKDDMMHTKHFYITQLHSDVKVILRLSWLQKHNPDTDWPTLSM